MAFYLSQLVFPVWIKIGKLPPATTDAAPPAEFVMGMQAPTSTETDNAMDVEEIDLNESKKIMLVKLHM